MNGCRCHRRAGLLAWDRLRRWACAVCAGLTACGPLVCQTADVGIWPHPSKPKPAGRIIVQCDGKPKVVLDADTVAKP